MIINKIKTAKRITTINPTPKQNKYLLSIGTSFHYGENYNGYGYADTVRVYELTSYQRRKYSSLGKIKAAPKLTEEEKYERWCKRLSKLTGISIAAAGAIAEQKIEYKNSQIDELEDRQLDSAYPSKRRDKLINKIRRSNPLRPIRDKDHASAILAAHDRHSNTDYEDQLEYARELANIGEIDREEIRNYARCNMAR